MAAEVAIKITADGKAVVTAAKQSTEALQGVGTQAGKTATALQGTSQASTGLNSAMQETGKSGQAASQGVAQYDARLAAAEKTTARYVAELDAIKAKQTQATVALGGGAAALDKTGISAKQTAAALRGVPAQFTDIVTSLQGGQAPLTVFLQQGGQLKDMFGGAGNAAKALGGYVLGMVNPFTVGAAAVAGLGYALYKGAEQQRAFQAALIVSGNAAGATAGQIAQAYASVSKSTGQYAASEDAITGLIRGRQVAVEQLAATASAVVKFSRAAGVEATALVEDFNAIGKNPVKAVLTLQEKYGILTAAVYQQAAALVEQGKQQEAVILVQNKSAEAMDKIGKAAKENKGYLESFWASVSSGAAGVWQGAMNLGKDQTPEARLEALRNTLADRQARGPMNGSAGVAASYAKGLANIQAEIDKVQALVIENQAVARAQGAAAEVNERATAGIVKLNSSYDQHLSKQEQLIKQLRELKIARDDALKGPDVKTKEVNDRYETTVEDLKRQLAPSYSMSALMHSLYLQESNNRQWDDAGNVVTNPKSGATGIAQIVPKYGADYARMAGVEWSADALKTDPEYGKKLAEAGIKTYLKMFGNDLEKALAAYNWGPGNLKNAIGQFGSAYKDHLPSETSKYISGILGRMPKDQAGDYSDALGGASSSAYEAALVDARKRLAQTTAEADAAQRGLTKSQTEFEVIQNSPTWKTYNASQQETLALSYKQIEVQDRIKQSADEGNKIKALADAQESANAVFGQSKIAIEGWRLAQLGANAAVAQALGQSPQLVAQLQKTAEEQQRYVAALKEADFRQTMQGLEEWKRSATEQASLYADEAKLAGLTALERAKVVASRQVELKLAKEIAAIEKKDWNTPEDKQKAIGLTNEAATVEKNAAVAKVVQDEWARTADQINQSLTDALMRGFESGKGFGQNLRDTLENMFKTLVLRPIISAIVSPVGQIASGAVNAGMSVMGLANSASGVSSLVNIGSAIGTGISQTIANVLPSAVSAGLGMTTSAAAAANAALIGGGASATAAASAAAAAGNGAALGGLGGSLTSTLAAIPGWGWAALGVAAVAAVVLGGKGDSRFGGRYTYDAANGAQYQQGPTHQDSASGVERGVVKSTADYINDTLKSVGSTQRLTGIDAGYESSEKGKGFSFAAGTVGGKAIGDANTFNNNRGSKNAEQAYAEFLRELDQLKIQALQSASDVPKFIADQLKGVDANSLSGEQAAAVLAQIDAQIKAVHGLQKSLDAMPFKNLTGLSFDAAAALAAAAGGMEALGSQLASYYDNFYSDEERRLQTIKEVNAATAGSGLDAATATRASYRKLMEAQDVTTESGQKMYAALLAASSAFATLAPAIDAVASARTDLIDAYHAEASAMQSTVDRFRTFATDLRGFRNGLLTGSLSPLTPGQRYAEASKEFDRLTNASRTGTPEERAAAMQGLQAAANALLEASRVYNASGSGYLMDFDKVREALAAAATSAAGTADVATLQLDAIKSQLTALGQIDKSVLSVAAAIAALAAAQRAAGTATNIPGFAVGTNYVPRDMLAQIHEGEAIVPRAYNPAAGARMLGGRNDDALVAEIKALREEVGQLRQQQSRETGALIQSNYDANAKNADAITARRSKEAWSKPVELV